MSPARDRVTLPEVLWQELCRNTGPQALRDPFGAYFQAPCGQDQITVSEFQLPTNVMPLSGCTGELNSSPDPALQKAGKVSFKASNGQYLCPINPQTINKAFENWSELKGNVTLITSFGLLRESLQVYWEECGDSLLSCSSICNSSCCCRLFWFFLRW